MEKITPIEYSKDICFKCLKKSKDIKTYKLLERGYGSNFDGTTYTLQLCEKCNCKELDSYFNETPTYEEYFYNYIHEESIAEFIDTLPVQGKELWENRLSYGWTSHNIDSQDWIDIELEIAPDEVYKKYSMYSPSEFKAYRDRFPTCKHTYNKEYNDGSIGCYCPYGASGDKDAKCGLNISDECYACTRYSKRVGNEITSVKADEVKISTINKLQNINTDKLNKITKDIDEWIELTGVLAKDSSYYYELLSIIEEGLK